MPHKLPALCVVLMLLSINTGCNLIPGTQNLTPTQKVTVLTDTYTAALRTLTAARTAGLIDDDDKASIENYRKIAAAALDEAVKMATTQLDKSAFERALDIARRAVEVLAEHAAQRKLQMERGELDAPADAHAASRSGTGVTGVQDQDGSGFVRWWQANARATGGN